MTDNNMSDNKIPGVSPVQLNDRHYGGDQGYIGLMS